MEADRALIVRQCLATDFVEFELSEGMIERCMPKQPPTAFGRFWRGIKPPIGNTAACQLTEVDKAKGFTTKFKNQQMLARLLQSALKPALMFIQCDFVLGVHETPNL